LPIDLRIIKTFNERAPFELKPDMLVVLSHVGSHSHGTYIPPSDPQAIDDVDYMGVIAPPVEFAVGLNQWEGSNFWVDELDVVFYSLDKFIRLLVKNNPNVLGMLWMRAEFYHHYTKAFNLLLAHRDAFSSQLAFGSFMGYAQSQLSRMTAFDEKATVEWDTAVARVTAAGWQVDDITNKSAALPMPNYAKLKDLLLPEPPCVPDSVSRSLLDDGACDEILTNAKVTIQKMHARHFQGYMGAKRKALVRKYGYDTKNAAHLIRLIRMCVEFLETGKLNVFREHDARELISIKQGEWSLADVQTHATALFQQAREMYEGCSLPKEPDKDQINNLMIELHRGLYFPDPFWDSGSDNLRRVQSTEIWGGPVGYGVTAR
jgi:hypothetical protein